VNQPFQFVAWLDTWACAAALRRHLDMFEDNVLPVRSSDGLWAFECRKDWPSLWNLLQHIQRHPLADEVELSAVRIERVQPMGWTPWLPAEPEHGHAEGRVALVTNPATYLLCGAAAQHLPIGHFCLVNRVLPCCTVNWGDTTPSFHLAIDLKSKPTNGKGRLSC
jgi:hypothetical protein